MYAVIPKAARAAPQIWGEKAGKPGKAAHSLRSVFCTHSSPRALCQSTDMESTLLA